MSTCRPSISVRCLHVDTSINVRCLHFYYYHWVDTYAVLAVAYIIWYIYYWNLQFLKDVIIINTKVLSPQTWVTLDMLADMGDLGRVDWHGWLWTFWLTWVTLDVLADMGDLGRFGWHGWPWTCWLTWVTLDDLAIPV